MDGTDNVIMVLAVTHRNEQSSSQVAGCIRYSHSLAREPQNASGQTNQEVDAARMTSEAALSELRFSHSSVI